MSPPPLSDRRLHFIGVGGAGMSGLALVCSQLGAQVTGSDRAESSYTARLRGAGIQPSIGHHAANLPPGAQVVVSTAIGEDNAELVAARDGGAPVIHRGRLLGEVSALKHSIAVAGTHGKTTTCAMIAHVLSGCGRRPAFLIGGELRSAGTNAAWGEGDWIVVEADESDGSFLELEREVAVVTNVELDHHHTYASLMELRSAFDEFVALARVRIAGPGAQIAGAVTYGLGEGDLSAEDIELRPLGARFTVAGVPVELSVPGRHNVANALAALAACREAGVALEEAAPALAGYTGTGRRFEEHGSTARGARVFDDYAHHPTEVRATLEAARTLGAHRLVACFQPHLYSRTRELARGFGAALAIADVVCVLDVYPARERSRDFPGVSGLLVAQAAADAAGGRRVMWTPTLLDAAGRLEAELGEGDVLLTLGAGDVDELARELTTARPTAGERA
ncbi:MAG: UDP-N-acetylmuramate--L-alanine ligase [Thermoleophilaceae bacterium]